MQKQTWVLLWIIKIKTYTCSKILPEKNYTRPFPGSVVSSQDLKFKNKQSRDKCAGDKNQNNILLFLLTSALKLYFLWL